MLVTKNDLNYNFFYTRTLFWTLSLLKSIKISLNTNENYEIFHTVHLIEQYVKMLMPWFLRSYGTFNREFLKNFRPVRLIEQYAK